MPFDNLLVDRAQGAVDVARKQFMLQVAGIVILGRRHRDRRGRQTARGQRLRSTLHASGEVLVEVQQFRRRGPWLTARVLLNLLLCQMLGHSVVPALRWGAVMVEKSKSDTPSVRGGCGAHVDITA